MAQPLIGSGFVGEEGGVVALARLNGRTDGRHRASRLLLQRPPRRNQEGDAHRHSAPTGELGEKVSVQPVGEGGQVGVLFPCQSRGAQAVGGEFTR